MRRTIGLGIVCAALTACGEQHEPLEVAYAEAQVAAGAAEKADGLQTSDACPATRFVGRALEGDCPRPQDGNWRTTALFSSDDAGEQVAVDDGMGDLCLYRWAGARKPTDRAVNELQRSLGDRVSGLGADCRVVAPLASPVSNQVWSPMRQAFVRAVNFPRDLAGDPRPVRVAVVDTSPRFYNDGRARGGTSGHGLTIGRIIRGLTCASDGAPSGACVGYISDHLALPRLLDGTVDRANGGYYGYFSEAAVSINAAVNAWQRHMAAPPPGEAPQQRLVINLSIGWDGVYGGAYDPARPVETQLSAPILAVHRAIERAVCHGALVIAAAGNDTGGLPVPTGPMFPGGWEQAPAPGDCHRFGNRIDDADVPPPDALYRPLVHSVGGVDGTDTALASTRKQGRPRLAASAFQAVMLYSDPTGGTGVTDVMSGTSAAAAVASATAALVWGYEPDLNGADVMARIYRSAVSLPPARADYCLGPRCATRYDVRRLSMCAALVATCPSKDARCPDPVDFDCPPLPAAHAGSNGDVPTAPFRAASTLPDQNYAGIATYDHGSVPECGASKVTSAHGSAPATWGVCPDRQAFTSEAAPWISPQPGVDPCPECIADEYLSGGYHTFDLYLAIDTAYWGETLEDATLTLDGKAVVDLAAYGMPTVTGGDVVYLSGVVCKTCSGVPKTAELAFSSKSSSAPTSQLVIK